MTEWTKAEHASVAKALLGSWPGQVAAWGREALAFYIGELEARGVTPAAALVAIRSCPASQAFPPSAPELAALARRDPGRPTFDECFQQLYGPGGVFGFRRNGAEISPWVEAFVDRYGRDRLRLLEVEHPEKGGVTKHSLRQSYEQFLEATEGRKVAEIAARSVRGNLGRPDFGQIGDGAG